MFSFRNRDGAHPEHYTAPTKTLSGNDINSTADADNSSANSLEPAIDGPPSPERIRAWTEQMKRNTIFGNNSRTNTLSSATSSFRSRDSAAASTENLSLSRKSSSRSNASNMPSEGAQKFGSIFSRGGRRSRRDNSLSKSTSSIATTDGIAEEEPRKGRGYRSGTVNVSPALPQEGQRPRPPISVPFDFRHVTHTRQENLPNLARSSHVELATAIEQQSEEYTNGELRDIKTQDLHFKNFSSEALDKLLNEEGPNQSSKTRQQRGVLRKSASPPQRPISSAKSHDNLKKPPPRPQRAPISPPCPVALPTRTSSRTASLLFDTFDAHAITRPQTAGAFRKPEFFENPRSAPLVFEQQEYFPERPPSHSFTPPIDGAWPLPTPPTGNFGVELTDVQEEDEEVVPKNSRISRTSSELRISRSFPSLPLRIYEQEHDGESTRTSTVLATSPSSRPKKSPLSPGFRFNDDSWEQDIDYCYEHEIEADCDYQWDQGPVEGSSAAKEVPSVITQPLLGLHLEDDDRSVYHGRFRPSLLVPSPYEVPELSPMSNTSTVSPDLRTPSNFLRPSHVRSPSHASSFKESHGFTLSPTLLIPSDFKSQMDQECLYEEQHYGTTSPISLEQERLDHPSSLIDETSSSIMSYHSSNFSRGSVRSSTTRLSASNSRGSQDSTILLGHAADDQAHRSTGSSSSLVDMIPSTLATKRTSVDKGGNGPTLQRSENLLSNSPGSEPDQPLRKDSLTLEPKSRKGANHFAPLKVAPTPSEAADEVSALSTVAESIVDRSKNVRSLGQSHGRKSSAPVLSSSVREVKGRARASTLTPSGTTAIPKKKSSYMLFPQT